LCETAGRYEQFLEGTLAESFLYILEPTIAIHSRKSDVDIVKQAATTASRTYKEISGRDISFEVQGTISDEAYVFISTIYTGAFKANPLRHVCLGAKEA
jgi:V-type H+-transporting ATPase subunit E